MEEELKGSMAGKQSELKGLKDILQGVEERRSNISAEMAQQEQFLQRYIANAQLIARDVEKAKRGVLQMEKVVNDVIKVQDAQLIKRQDRLDAASATVSRVAYLTVCQPVRISWQPPDPYQKGPSLPFASLTLLHSTSLYPMLITTSPHHLLISATTSTLDQTNFAELGRRTNQNTEQRDKRKVRNLDYHAT